MSCACVLKLADLLKGLVPPVEIPVPEIPALEPLAAIAAPLSATRGMTSASFSALASMPPLPAIPLDPIQITQVQAATQAASQMTAMGLSPVNPLTAPRLAATIGALNINFAAVPIPAPPPASLLALSMVCARVTAVRSMLGVDLLSPMAMPRLSASLAVATPAPAPPPALPSLTAYAALTGGATSLGGIQAILPVLTALASLSIPALTVPIPSLTNLLAMLMAVENVKTATGIHPCMPGAIPAIQARLAPLAQLEGFQIPPATMTAASASASFMPVRPMLSGMAALPGLNLAPLATLQLPNLAPLTLALTAVNTAGVTSSSACSSSCPMGGKF